MDAISFVLGEKTSNLRVRKLSVSIFEERKSNICFSEETVVIFRRLRKVTAAGTFGIWLQVMCYTLRLQLYIHATVVKKSITWSLSHT